MKFLVLFTIIFSAPVFAAETSEFDAKGINDVEISSLSGKVTLTGSNAAKATVIATKNKFDEKCSMTIEKRGDTLFVKVEKKKTLSLDECNVDLEVKVPTAVDVDLAVGTGTVIVNGITGDFEYAMGSGDVTAEGTFEKIEGKTGTGDLFVKGLTGGGDIKMGTGKATLIFATSALKGEINLKTGTGDAILNFPKGSKVKTSFRAGTGDLVNELGDSPVAEFNVTMKSGTGDLSIKTY